MIIQVALLRKYNNFHTNYFRINEAYIKFLYFKRNNIFKFMEKNQHSNTINKRNNNIFLYDINSYQIKEDISLNQKEIQIFSLINNVLQKNNKNTICRVAGGWVRDKVNINN